MSLRALWYETPLQAFATELGAELTPAASAWAPADQFVQTQRRLPAVIRDHSGLRLGVGVWGLSIGQSAAATIGASSIQHGVFHDRQRCVVPFDALLNFGDWGGGQQLLRNRWSHVALGLWEMAGGVVHIALVAETVATDAGHTWTRPLLAGVVTPETWLSLPDIDAMRYAAQTDETQHAWSSYPIEMEDGEAVQGSFAGCWRDAARVRRCVHCDDIHGTADTRFPPMKLHGWRR